MSYYEPLYYPYYSAREGYGPEALELENKIRMIHEERALRDRIQYEKDIVKEEQLLNEKRNRQYEEELRNKQRLDHIYEHRLLRERADEELFYQAKEQDILHLTYLEKLEKLKRQRDILELGSVGLLPKSYPPLNRQFQEDQQLIKQYQNGRRAQQYQQELLDKINSHGQEKFEARRNANENQSAKKQKTNNYIRDPLQSNKKEGSNKKNHQNENSAFKRSYIDELRGSQHHSFTNDTIHKNLGKIEEEKTYEIKNKRGETIDVNLARSKYEPSPPKIDKNHQIEEAYCKPRYLKSHSKQKNNRSKSKIAFGLNFERSPLKRSKMNDHSTNALKKIENRLKLSAIVYKDSKWKNIKHQIGHLFNTIENQTKSRKEIKDKINNHPKILKKHALVVESR